VRSSGPLAVSGETVVSGLQSDGEFDKPGRCVGESNLPASPTAFA
jgi:hypothetical protein